MTARTHRGLRAFRRQVLPAIARATDGGRIFGDVERIIRTDRWNSFDKFHETTATLTDLYDQAGAETDVYTIPTGGPIGAGRWVIAEAADIRAATVDILRPVRERIIDYRENPWQVIQWSAGTPTGGMTCEVVVIDNRDQLAKAGPRSLVGKAVLTKMTGPNLLGALAPTGAAAVITDRGAPDLPKATQWAKFGWGAVAMEHAARRLVGLALSVEQGKRLRRLIEQHRTVTVRIRADIRHYVGTHDLISGVVVGQNGDEEVWALAHSAEPGAIDNASGVAICVEIARILNAMIRGGRLPQPRRSIRLLNGYECYSFFHYLEHGRRLAPPLAGVCIDSLGAKPQLCDGRIQWHDTADMSAGFVNDLGAAVIRSALRLGPPLYKLRRMPFVPTLDTLICDPKYGFPCPWVNTHYRRPLQAYSAYHSSADTPDLLSRDGLAVCAAAMAGYLYYLADAGNHELLQLADSETRKAVRALKSLAKTHKPQARPVRAEYIRRQHEVSMRRLARWIWGGDRREILTRLAGCGGEVADAARAAVRRIKPVRRRIPAADKRIPRRTAPLIPQLENAPPPIAQRIGNAQLRHRDLFWADGTRNLAEIADAIRCERNQDISARRVREFFEAQEELGYVEIIDPAAMVTKRQLIADLKALGLERGMDVMLHSSLSKIGHVAGGADAVIDAIASVIGRRGTILAPTFNFGAAKVYNVATTPGRTGSIPEAMRLRGEAERSDHPTHSCVALGANAAKLCAGHVAAGVWSADSPIGRLIHRGGYILSLGVSQIYSTAYHVAEVSMPCGGIDPFGNQRRVVDADGAVVSVPAMAYRSKNCPVTNDRLGAILDRRKLRRHGAVGAAHCTLVKGLDLWTVQRNRLRRSCRTCRITPNYAADR